MKNFFTKNKYFPFVVGIFIFIIFAFFINNNSVYSKQEIVNNKIEVLVFSQPACYHCKDFKKFVENNRKKYKDVNFKILEIINQDNYDLLMKKAEELGIANNMIGTPLIIVGNNYIMGWTNSFETKLDEYINNIKNVN